MFTLTTVECGINSDSQHVGLVPTPAVPTVWPQVVSIMEAHKRGIVEVSDFSDIFTALCQGGYELWVALNSRKEIELVAICGWERYSKQSFYHLIWVGGTGLAKHMAEGLKEIEKYACWHGATYVIMNGREGWKRKLTKFGYVPTLQMRKPVRRVWGN